MNKTNHLAGESSSCYKNGIGFFFKYRKYLKETQNICCRCGKDLTNATRYEWCVHHKDHDRTHNTPDNLELLCKKCHQLEHECTNALKIKYEKECYVCGKHFISKANNAKYCATCNKIYRRWKHKMTAEEVKEWILKGNV